MKTGNVVKTLGMLIAVCGALTLSGCALGPSVGQLMDMPASDSDLATIQVPHTSGTAFVNNVKDIAHQLGYEIHAMDGKGETERQVLLHKQSTDMVGAFIGRDWQESVLITMEADGRTVQVTAKIVGNNHKADPGTAKKVVEEFKAHLLQANIARNK